MPNVRVGRLRGGFCAYWWENGRRVRHQLDARSRAEAEPEALDVYRRETFTASGATVMDCWEAYRLDLGDRPTGKTMGWTGKAILPHFGAYRPDQITRELCREYARKRAEAGKEQGTVHTELGHLRSALTFAKKVKMIPDAPDVWRPEKPEPTIRVLERDQVRAVIDATHDPHIRLAVILLFGTAARVGAILDLEWKRVSFSENTINLRIHDSVRRKGRAILPMSPGIRAALSAAHEAALSDYVIEYAGGRVKSIRKGVTNALARAGIEGMTIHGFRHTAAVTMLQAGVPISKVSQVLGHSNTRVTETVYARYLPQHMQDAVDVIDFAKLRRA